MLFDVRQKMKTIYFLVFIVIVAICACKKTAEQDAYAEIQQRIGYWKIAGADAFADGGSYCLSFMSPSGRILHVFARPDSQRIGGKLVIEVARSYNDRMVVDSGSEVEGSVLWLLDHYQEVPEVRIGREYATSFSRVIKDRSGPFPIPKMGFKNEENHPGEQEAVSPNGP